MLLAWVALSSGGIFLSYESTESQSFTTTGWCAMETIGFQLTQDSTFLNSHIWSMYVAPDADGFEVATQFQMVLLVCTHIGLLTFQ